MADGFLPPLRYPETGTLASILYPLRGAEALAMVTIMGIVFWGFTVLVPEYCLGIWDDANLLGTPSVGRLVILISALPVFLLLPLVLIYMLQYLGRVLVSSAMGDTVPPRTPDRNFDGFFTGLSPWIIWLVFGAFVGLLPLVLHTLFMDQLIPGNPWLAVGLVTIGLPYAQAALMMSFLHDQTFAPVPASVIYVLLRHGNSLLPAFLKTSVLLGMGALAFVLALTLRGSYFWLYILAALCCWVLAIWVAIVVLHILGVCYFHLKDSLKWHTHRPRWGVAWKL
jgi:hypothetical protein